jgi:hypothetical protein
MGYGAGFNDLLVVSNRRQEGVPVHVEFPLSHTRDGEEVGLRGGPGTGHVLQRGIRKFMYAASIASGHRAGLNRRELD